MSRPPMLVVTRGGFLASVPFAVRLLAAFFMVACSASLEPAPSEQAGGKGEIPTSSLQSPNVWRPCERIPGGGVRHEVPANCDPAYCCDDCDACDTCLDEEGEYDGCMQFCLEELKCTAKDWHVRRGEEGRIRRRIPRNDTDPFTPEEGFQNWLECDVDQFVIHRCEGAFRSCVNTLMNPYSMHGAHFVISEGGAVVQLSAPEVATWHCGTRDKRCNCRSIGIEHAGVAADGEPSEAQLVASAELVADLCVRLGIPCRQESVIGHRDAPDYLDANDERRDNVPVGWTRNTLCPAGWPWGTYRRLLEEAFRANGQVGSPSM